MGAKHKPRELLWQAAYHGVPIAGIPLIGDQADNIVKAVVRGFGVMVPVEHVGIQSGPVLNALTVVLSDPSFKLAARRVSVRMRARPRTPLEEAAGGEWSSSPALPPPPRVLLSLSSHQLTSLAEGPKNA